MKLNGEVLFNWQQKGWPKFSFDQPALDSELEAFALAFERVQRALAKPQSPNAIMNAMVDEAVKTSAIEGVRVDESVVMSSICKALGMTNVPLGFTKDLRAEGVAQMVLFVKFVATWRKAVSTPESVALKATFLHPHFELIHPFEDGNGRVGRALVAKTLAEGLGASLVLPVSLVIDRHRKDYYEAINGASRSLDWTDWAKFFIPVLTETLNDFVSASRFVAAKGEYLAKYERLMSERARAVILRMFRDGPIGVSYGLSAAKWMRMTKVSKPTATRDLDELEKTGAIIREGDGASIRYKLNFNDEPLHEPLFEPLNEPLKATKPPKNKGENDIPKKSRFNGEPINEPLNEGINERLVRLIATHPGAQLSYLKSVIGKSLATIKRAMSVLVMAGKIEHRGSKKTGGYWVKNLSNTKIRRKGK